jgi:hypothetical protein
MALRMVARPLPLPLPLPLLGLDLRRMSTAAAPSSAAPGRSSAPDSGAPRTRGRAMGYVYTMLGFNSAESKRGRASAALLRACVAATDLRAWHDAGRVPMNWRSKHVLLTTYAWLVHKRLLKEGTEGQKLQEVFFDALWTATCIRMRHAGIDELFIRKNLKGVQDYSFEALVSYDDAMTKKDEEEKVDALAGAIWRNVFQSMDGIGEEHVIGMSRHIYAELQSVLDIPSEAVMEGRLEFADPPTWVKSAEGGSPPLLTYHGGPTVDQVGDWRVELDISGKEYWWNVRTSASTRTPPHLSKSVKN